MLREFYAILCALNRQAELKRLAAWAERKRLPGPRKLYLFRLADEETRLMRHRFRSPRLTAWARVAHRLHCLVNPAPRYPAKGAAAKYRYRNQTTHRLAVFRF